MDTLLAEMLYTTIDKINNNMIDFKYKVIYNIIFIPDGDGVVSLLINLLCWLAQNATASQSYTYVYIRAF